jgi:glycosyltransferase involved in cell wall biosynthesis
VDVGLLLEQCLAPVPGGTGRYSRELAAALARTAPSGHEVRGWTALHADVSAARVPGVRGPRRLPLGRRALARAWERGHGPDVPGTVRHAPTPLAPPRRGRPLVVTVHDAVPWTHPETLTRRGAAWHRRAVENAARSADLVVVPTRAAAEQLAEHVALPRVRVIGAGVTTSLARPADADQRARRLGLPPEFLLSLATLEPRKGLDVLLDALALPAAPDLPLLVVGPQGWGGVDVAAEAARRGLSDGRVRVLGWLPDEDVAVLLAAATALVAPSRAEGFGLPVLEAMAAGTPAVTSADPALVEVGGGATLVAADAEELAVQLGRVAGDTGLQEQLRTAGRQRARAYDWDAGATELWRCYEAVSGG